MSLIICSLLVNIPAMPFVRCTCAADRMHDAAANLSPISQCSFHGHRIECSHVVFSCAEGRRSTYLLWERAAQALHALAISSESRHLVVAATYGLKRVAADERLEYVARWRAADTMVAAGDFWHVGMGQGSIPCVP